MKRVFLSFLIYVLSVSSALAAMSDSDFIKLCQKGSLQQIIDAIKNGANVNAKNNDGITPLMMAIDNSNSSKVVTALIKAGADVNAKEDKYGLTPLIMVMTKEDINLEAVITLIKAGADVNVKNENGFTLLMSAACSPNPEVITAFIKAGAEVNAKDENGFTPLMMAAGYNSNPNVIATLVKAGADVHVRTEKNVNKLPVFKTKISILLELKLIKMMIFVYPALGNHEVMLDTATLKEYTPLLFAAASNSNPEVIAALIKAKADVNDKDSNGYTPLMLIMLNENSNLEVIAALIKSGANVNARSDRGLTPLMMATSHNSNPEVITALIKAGADVNAKAEYGMTSLMFAALNSNPEAIIALLQHGANPKTKNKYGQMAIDFAREEEKLKNTDVFWKLNDASY